MTKQYKLFKTVKKTAKENNFLIAENNLATTKTLFDFSELDNINLEEWEKDVIKNLQSYLKVQRRIFAEAA